jgi:hypothetical protein
MHQIYATLNYTAQYITLHTIYLDEIPSDRIRTSQMFVRILHTEHTQLRNYTCVCFIILISQCYNFILINYYIV